MRKKSICLVSMVLVLSLTCTSLGQPVDPALVGWWKLDETSGNTALDSSGNGRDGTLQGDPQWVAGWIDGALEFDGDDHVDTGYTEDLANWTIAAWAISPAAPSGDSPSGPVHREMNYQFNWNHGDATFRGAAALRVGGTWYAASYMPLEANTWYHLAASYDGNALKAYRDGVLITTNTSPSGNPDAETNTLKLGRHAAAAQFFTGTVDDVRVYNRVLTDAEIKQLIPLRYKAYKPSPEDGAIGVTTPLVQWKAGDTAAYHDVYFGTDPDALEFQVRYGRVQTLYYHQAGVTPGTTYYWRIDEVEADETTIHTGDVWSFFVTPLKPWDPTPADGATDVLLDASVSWQPGRGAIMYNVYVGDNFDDVDNGTGDTHKATITETTYAPEGIRPDTIVYWRVDLFDGLAWQKGDIWSYTTIAGGTGRIIREWWLNIGGGTAIGDLTGNANYPDNPTGWEFVDLFEGPVNWDNNYGSRLRGWLFPPATGDYTFWISTDDNGQLWLSTDEDPANTQLIASEDSWTDSRVWEDGNEKSSPITLEEGKVYYIEALMKEGGGGDNIAVAWQGPIGTQQVLTADYVGVTPFLPVKAYSPSPGNGATDVTDAPTLTWLAGERAAQHDVFFGTDRDAVANADTTTAGIYRGRQALTATSYVPTEVPLAWDTTYFWRIDELNTADPEAPWQGNVWSFTTADFIIVEDFEQYDDFCNRIFYMWADGWGYSEDPDCGVTASTGNGTDSTVGNLNAPFAEQTIVHDGIQSMPFEYNNTGTGGKARYSEASREFATGQNWTRNEVKALTLWFHGETGNAPETLYVALEDSAGQVRVANHPEPEALQVPDWQQWNIALTQFSGVNLAGVKKLYIGVGNRNNPQAGGSGKLYIDDIRVYPARCVPSLAKPAVDLSDNCIVDYADVEIISDQWLDSGFVVTPTDPGNLGLIAHYPLNGNANDVVGGNNGTTSGMVSYTTGKIGQALLLDGLDDYAGTNVSLLNDMSAFTLAGWVSARNPRDSRIGLFGQNDAIEFGFDGGNISIWTAGGGSAAATWTLMDLMWHHVAAVGDGTGLNVYIDGQLAASGGTTTTNYGTSTYFFNMGGGGVWDDVDNWLSGKIDEVYVYNRALSDAEVASLAGHTSPLSIPADLYQDDVIDFKDLAVLADAWLEQILWP